jgi:hypothetical protein
MRKKKSKIVMVDGIPIRPISAAEHRRIDRRIKKKNEKRRKRYREVHGKRVDWISHWIEEGILFFTEIHGREALLRHLQSVRQFGHRGFFGYVHGRRRNSQTLLPRAEPLMGECQALVLTVVVGFELPALI